MRLLIILLVFLNFELYAKTVIIGPPEGYSFFWAFKPNTELEKNAFDAVKDHLAKNKGNVSNYYLSTSKLNVSSAVYEFKVKHYSEFRNSKHTMYMPFLSGSFFYNVKSKSVTFVREPLPNKQINQDK